MRVIKILEVLYPFTLLLILFSSFRFRNSRPLNERIENTDLMVVAKVNNPEVVLDSFVLEDGTVLSRFGDDGNAHLEILAVLKGNILQKEINIDCGRNSWLLKDKDTVLVFLEKTELESYKLLGWPREGCSVFRINSEQDISDILKINNYYNELINNELIKLEGERLCKFLCYCAKFPISRNSAADEFYWNQELVKKLNKKQEGDILNILLDENQIEDWFLKLASVIDVYQSKSLSEKILKEIQLSSNERMKSSMKIFLQDKGKYPRLEYFYKEFNSFESLLYKHEMVEMFSEEVIKILELR